MKDRRNPHPRYQVSHQASILVGDRNCRVFCTLKDMSITGARLGSVPLKSVPESFSISIPDEDVILSCRLRWTNGTEIGVEFEGDPQFLKDPLDADADQVWAQIDLQMRQLVEP
jgi:hypothetical protein